MRTVERAARVGVGAWNDSGVTVARESAMADLEKGDERINYRRFALCWQACATFQLASPRSLNYHDGRSRRRWHPAKPLCVSSI